MSRPPGRPRRLLIVCPNFAPMNTPDQHRARVMLPYLLEQGWEVKVLALRPGECDGVHDPGLLETLPDGVEIVRCGALPRRLTRLVGLGSTGIRALPFVLFAGSRLIRRWRPDVVFFSTTVFPVMVCGVWWRRRHGVPYVLDFQDPWRNDHHDRPGADPPPGGWLKYRLLSRPVARTLEPPSVRHAARIVCVSEHYARTFHRRYGVERRRFLVSPFAASERDLVVAARLPDGGRVRLGEDPALRHWVCAGVLADGHRPFVRAFLEAFAGLRHRDPASAERVRIHFLGTSYDQSATGRTPWLGEIIQDLSLGDHVVEQRRRLPYLAALRATLDADAIIVLGTTDPTYNPSKLAGCLMTGRPLIALLHPRSPGADVIRRAGAPPPVLLAPVDPSGSRGNLDELLASVLAHPPGFAETRDRDAFLPLTAEGMTARLARVLMRASRHSP